MGIVKAKIRKWFGDKGFGFAYPATVRPQDRSSDIFVHAKALDPGLQHLTRLDYPVYDADGRVDRDNSPPWPEVYIEWEPSEKGTRARRVSLTEFNLGEPCVDMPVASAPSAPSVGGAPDRPNGRPARAKGPVEGQRRPSPKDKGGGGRRGTWGQGDDDF